VYIVAESEALSLPTQKKSEKGIQKNLTIPLKLLRISQGAFVMVELSCRKKQTLG
jgi:hypothetical protein